MLRLDVDGDDYVIPTDNPSLGGRAEIWASGLRNPWRFWIDAESGLMAIGDVGQNAFEEVDVVPLDPVGYNFGWPISEGLHCFSPSSGCDVSEVTLPVVEVAHGDAGTCSITGGVVYRGAEIPELDGVYLFSDFCGGYVRGFPVTDPSAVTDYTTMFGGTLGQVSSFGLDADGELYVVTPGNVFRVFARR